MAILGRPKSDKKRQQILKTATDMFTAQGYANTSLDQVAAAAGVSKQTIYSHFSSKDNVLREGVKHQCMQAQLTVDQSDLSLSPEIFLPIFAARFVGTLLEDTALRMYRLCLNEGERHPELGLSFFESGPKLVIQALAQYLAAATARNQMQVSYPELAAAQFLFMVKGLPVEIALLNLQDQPYEISNEVYIEETCAMFVRAYPPT
ncbi:MAG: TetR/AcrR family transcriptional repressor of mexJK operon [Halioglobus sp.]|jgi:TetR/AcrR family transcriptional repressor of mexJK operon